MNEFLVVKKITYAVKLSDCINSKLIPCTFVLMCTFLFSNIKKCRTIDVKDEEKILKKKEKKKE